MALATVQRRAKRGLALPTIRTLGGYFASKSEIDTAWGDLLLTLFTPFGSRWMRRDFGSGAVGILFEPNIAENVQLLEFIIRDAAEQWVPQVEILEVEVEAQGKEIQVSISFRLREGEQTIQARQMLRVDRSAIIRILAAQQRAG